MLKTIILAAGKSTRMKSKKSKVFHKLLNREMIYYVLDSVSFDNSDIIIVGGENYGQLKEKFPNFKVLEQKIGEGLPYGTGFATYLAMDYIDDKDDVLIVFSDTPLVKKETMDGFYEAHRKNGADVTLMTTKFDNPFGYGRILRDETGKFIKIVEEKDASPEERKIEEVTPGFYIFKGKALRESLKNISNDNAQGEYYLPDCVKYLLENGGEVSTYFSSESSEFFGVNDRAQLAEAEKILRKRVNEAYMKDGVTIQLPEEVTIEPGVKIGRDTEIYGPVSILGKSEIGEDCTLIGSTRIIDSKIGRGVKVDNSLIEESVMEDESNIGPYSHLRPRAHLGEKVHIGNFVEVKNSQVGAGTKAGHLAYIGDSDLGKDINVGCGVIFVNYDGKFKHRSIVEDGAFIGSNSNIVAPVHIEKEGYVAAGSTITKDVPEGNLSIERADQKNVAGYVEKKKKRDIEKLKEQK